MSAVDHPKHYQGATGIEAIDVIEGFGLNFHTGNAVKYILRHRNKGGIEDLQKAVWYLQREISREEPTRKQSQRLKKREPGKVRE